jgi:hypothetical protein
MLKLIKINTDEQVNLYVVALSMVLGRNRIKVPFDPIVDSGRVKYITFYPNEDEAYPATINPYAINPYYGAGTNWFSKMYAPEIIENGTAYLIPAAGFQSRGIMLTLAKKGGGYIFFDMPITNFLPNYGGNYRITCDYDVDFDRSFVRYFIVGGNPDYPQVIPLFFTMWPQDGVDTNYKGRRK